MLCRALRFEFIQNTVITDSQRRMYNFRKPVAILTYHIDTRLQAGFPRTLEDGCGHGSVDWIGQVETVEKQEIAKMKDSRLASCEVEMSGVEKRIGAAL